MTMGGLLGHVALGAVFLFIGLWHLYNHAKLHATHKHHYKSPLPWFPTPYNRHLELYLIMAGCITFTISELHNRPFLDPDGTIPAIRLHHYEHASMAMSFVLYCLTAISLDRLRPTKGGNDLVWLVASLAFSHELLLFHFHSTDHVGIERQYHLLLELVILVCLATTLMGIAFPRSFVVSFVRSLSVTLQGIWLALMGLMLWTPSLIPKGCAIQEKNGREIIACEGEGSLDRAKALVNIEFSWILIALTAFAVSFCIMMARKYDGLMVLNGDEDARFRIEDEDRLLHAQRGLPTIDLE